MSWEKILRIEHYRFILYHGNLYDDQHKEVGGGGGLEISSDIEWKLYQLKDKFTLKHHLADVFVV